MWEGMGWMWLGKAPCARPKPGRGARIGGGGDVPGTSIPSCCPDRLPRRLLSSPHKQPQALAQGPPTHPQHPPYWSLAGAKSQSLRQLRGSAPDSGTRLLLRRGDAPALAARLGQDGGEQRGGSLQPSGLSLDWC